MTTITKKTERSKPGHFCLESTNFGRQKFNEKEIGGKETYYFENEPEKFKQNRKKAQKSQKDVFQSVLINDKVVKPIELYLNEAADINRPKAGKMPLEVLKEFLPDEDRYITRLYLKKYSRKFDIIELKLFK
jgi:hypothetical protein